MMMLFFFVAVVFVVFANGVVVDVIVVIWSVTAEILLTLSGWWQMGYGESFLCLARFSRLCSALVGSLTTAQCRLFQTWYCTVEFSNTFLQEASLKRHFTLWREYQKLSGGVRFSKIQVLKITPRKYEEQAGADLCQAQESLSLSGLDQIGAFFV